MQLCAGKALLSSFCFHGESLTTTGSSDIGAERDIGNGRCSTAILERSSRRRVDDRKVSSVELPQRGLQWFDLDGAEWQPPEPVNQQEDPQELLLRLLMEQRRTNDLLMELIQLNRQRSERPQFVKR